MMQQPQELIPIREVLKRTGFSRAALYRAIRTGNFPRGVAISERSVRWDSLAVADWITKKVEAARQVAA